MGAFHSAIEVYGREWSYGLTDEGTGVFSCEPRGSTQHCFRESIIIGETTLCRREVANLLRQLEWPGSEYHIIRKNCCHWCEAFCRSLGAAGLPQWVNKVAS